MHKIDGAGHVANAWVAEDVALSRPPTEITADFMNALQLEIANVVEYEGGVLNKADNTQLLKKILSIVKGGDYKDSVRFTTTANIVLTGLGTKAGGDWPAALTAAERILVKNQTAPAENGLYTAAAGAWARASDADTGAELNSGAIIPVESGTTLDDTNWQLTTDGTITIGTTALVFGNVTGITQAQADARYTGIGYMLVRDEKAQNTAGGASTAATNHIRALNTVSANTITGASLSANQITLPAGTYRVRASAPCTGANLHRAYLHNVTDVITQILGSCENATELASASVVVTTRSEVVGRFVLAAAKVFELRHYIQEAFSTGLGGGAINSGGVEIYSQIEIIKES